MSANDLPVETRINRRFIIVMSGCAICLFVCSLVFRRLTIPMIGGLFLAYLSVPAAAFCERRLKMPRMVAALYLMASLTGIIVFGIFQLVPLIYVKIQSILDLVPEAFKLLELKWLPLLKQTVAGMGFLEFVRWLNNISVTEIVRQLGNRSGTALERIWMATPSFVAQILNLGLIPVISFCVLIERQRIGKAFYAMMPLDTRDKMNSLIGKFDNALGAVITGQLIIATIMGALYMVGLGAIGLGSGIAIGAIAGVCRLVPYLDLVVGISLSIIVILTEFSTWTQVAAMFAVFLSVQTIDGMFLTPRIIGTKVGLHPLIVVMSVIAFADWFGVWGVLLAMPVVALLSVLIAEVSRIYRASKFFAG